MSFSGVPMSVERNHQSCIPTALDAKQLMLTDIEWLACGKWKLVLREWSLDMQQIAHLPPSSKGRGGRRFTASRQAMFFA